MPVFLSALLKRTMLGYLILAICLPSLVSAHVHLSETHSGPHLHAHATEIHFAHFESGHDNLDGHAPHTTDATAVDIDGEVGISGVSKIPDVVAIAVAILFLLAVPFRTEYRFPSHTTPQRSRPHYSPLRARAPPR